MSPRQRSLHSDGVHHQRMVSCETGLLVEIRGEKVHGQMQRLEMRRKAEESIGFHLKLRLRVRPVKEMLNYDDDDDDEEEQQQKHFVHLLVKAN